MLTSTTEEKENRVIEMILTTIEARTLIVGKIISLVALAFLQGALMILPVVIAYFALHNQLNLPSLDLSTIPVNWSRIGVSAAIFVASFSIFPLTAPIPLLLRNAVGNLQSWEIAVALPVMAITAIIILALAVRVFRYGALEYSRKLSLREILR
jgi:ABC-2 type transport system permease protein